VLVAAACGTRAHNRAVQVMSAYARSRGQGGKVTCSGGIGGMHARTPDFVCQVTVGPTTCDQFEVRRRLGHWHVTPRRRRVDCVLPA
jgi:hypothetical protein